MNRSGAVIPRLVAGAAVTATLVLPVAPASAAGALVLSTPYPSVEAQPGSTVDFDLTVENPQPEAVGLVVSGLEDGWSATIRGGGFVIHEITAEPDAGASATLEVDVPPDAPAGEHHLTIEADGPDGARSAVDLVLVVAEHVDNGITLSADFPSLSGEPGGTFTYQLTVDNETPVEQTFTFDPSGPQGWTVSASPTAEARAQTVTIDAGGTSDINVTATAPATVDEGQYPIDVAVVGANGASGSVTLQAEIVGTPDLGLTTADERLDVSGAADHVQRVPMIVSNTGSAALESVKLAGTAPSDWDVSFEPQELDSILPGETAQVTAVVTPSADAVAGDYAMTVRASAGSLSSNVDLRYTVEGSRTLGVVAVGVIVAAFVALAAVFVRFGRR